MSIKGFTDWKTTVPAVVAAFFSFVLFKPEYFPPVLQDVAAFIFAGGLAVFGINSASSKPDPTSFSVQIKPKE